MTRPLTDRNAEIVSLHDSGSTDAEIAAVYGIAPQRVGQIVRAEIDAPRRPGRRRTGPGQARELRHGPAQQHGGGAISYSPSGRPSTRTSAATAHASTSCV